jgi:hypothetical protein
MRQSSFINQTVLIGLLLMVTVHFIASFGINKNKAAVQLKHEHCQHF